MALRVKKRVSIWQRHDKTFTLQLHKKSSKSTLLELNRILNSLSHENKIGHLVIVDIKFFNKDEKALLFNEIYTPIFEKEKMTEPQHRSVLQLMSIINRNEEKDITRKMTASAKTHATLEEKKIIPLYAEHIHFLVKRAGWLVTKIYQDFTFAQSKYKKDFVITNQKSRQKATTDAEKDL